MRFDTVVFGGGPAGLAAALRMARAGEKVLLVEQRSLPQKKCCGEFLHPSAVHELGILLGHRPGGTSIGRVRIDSGQMSREFPISDAALSMEREILSSSLLEAAGRSGVRIVTNGAAEVASLEENCVEIRARNDLHSTDKVIAAEGSSSMTIRRFGDARSARRTARIVYGFSTRISARFPAGVALAAVRGGYVGLCDLGNSGVNLAGLLSESAYRRMSPNRPNFGERLLAEVPGWEGIVPSEARGTLFQAPVYAGMPEFGNAWPDRIFVAGDAAGIIETAFGDGIARAFRQARLLEESFRRHPNLSMAKRDYISLLRRDAHQPDRRLLHLAGACLRNPAVASLLLRSAAPWIRRLAMRATAPAPAG